MIECEIDCRGVALGVLLVGVVLLSVVLSLSCSKCRPDDVVPTRRRLWNQHNYFPPVQLGRTGCERLDGYTVLDQTGLHRDAIPDRIVILITRRLCRSGWGTKKVGRLRVTKAGRKVGR